MQYTGMSIRQSVTLVILTSNGLATRGLFPCSLNHLGPQSHLLSLSAQPEYSHSLDARGELGMVEHGRFFLMGKFPAWVIQMCYTTAVFTMIKEK